jgi:acyl carrier protein
MNGLPQDRGAAGSPHERIIGLAERILERKAGAAPLAPTARFSELGMSSMKMINLMIAIEVEFDLTIPQAEITPDNFESLTSVEALVVRLLGSAPGV